MSRVRILGKLCRSAFLFHFPLSRVALLPRRSAGAERTKRRITKECLTGDGALARAAETPEPFSGGGVGFGKNVSRCKNDSFQFLAESFVGDRSRTATA